MSKYRSAMNKIIVTPEMEDKILKNVLSAGEPPNERKRQPCRTWVRYAGACAACCAIALFGIMGYPSLTAPNGADQLTQTSPSADVPVETGNQEEPPAQAPVSSSNPKESEVQPGAGKPPTSRPTGKTQSESRPAQPSEKSDDRGEDTAVPGGLQAQAPVSSGNTEETGTKTGENTQSTGNPAVEVKGLDELKKKVAFDLFVPKTIPNGYEIDSTSVIFGKLAQIIYSDGANEITYRAAKETEDISGDYTSYEEIEVEMVGDNEVTLKGSKSLIHLAAWTKDNCSYSLSFSAGLAKENVESMIESMTKA